MNIVPALVGHERMAVRFKSRLGKKEKEGVRTKKSYRAPGTMWKWEVKREETKHNSQICLFTSIQGASSSSSPTYVSHMAQELVGKSNLVISF